MDQYPDTKHLFFCNLFTSFSASFSHHTAKINLHCAAPVECALSMFLHKDRKMTQPSLDTLGLELDFLYWLFIDWWLDNAHERCGYSCCKQELCGMAGCQLWTGKIRLNQPVSLLLLHPCTVKTNSNPLKLPQHKNQKLKYIHRITFLHATSMFTYTKHTEVSTPWIDVSPYFVQITIKTLTCVGRLGNTWVCLQWSAYS